MDGFSDEAIIESWRKNAIPWINAIRNSAISSRVDVTDNAIVTAVMRGNPKTVLDVGCGEGWLIRALSAFGIDCTGIDAVPEFSECVEKSGGRFLHLPYELFGAESFTGEFDAVVCNFSLLGKESVERVIEHSPHILATAGTLIIQTLHPVEASTPETYVDGWRKGDWRGIGGGFVEPAPWYFRTLGSWEELLSQAGFTHLKVTEPRHPNTGARMSVIFEATRSDQSSDRAPHLISPHG
ncbi:MAG: class I SAM-dependent methyltransferase [Marinobacter sp.]|uniref:class I SAM-dependent methyltransferase n=1 Tax=Marinobacter sp. TaxID=50741 RepID=UPI00299CD9DB|nr:class I SAM-dependent methyltransferase [Marinobacter sp.]MDX1755708.1 class I SAM-dependent methyltransferase [Marinobacter sp.]